MGPWHSLPGGPRCLPCSDPSSCPPRLSPHRSSSCCARCSSHPPVLLPHPCRPRCEGHDEGGQVLGGGGEDVHGDGGHGRDEGDGGDGQHGGGELVSLAGPSNEGRSHIYLFEYL